MIKMKLIMAVMHSGKESLDKAVSELKKEFGEIDSQSDEYDFIFTDYYEKESGKNLKKIFVSFKKTISKEGLSEIRIKTGKIEDKLRIEGKRRVNIDPGYISEEGVFMASLKQKPFKENIGNNVFLHKVLGFDGSKIVEFKHTFADYKIEQTQEFFRKILASCF